MYWNIDTYDNCETKVTSLKWLIEWGWVFCGLFPSWEDKWWSLSFFFEKFTGKEWIEESIMGEWKLV